jgi:hypothetical protein
MLASTVVLLLLAPAAPPPLLLLLLPGLALTVVLLGVTPLAVMATCKSARRGHSAGPKQPGMLYRCSQTPAVRPAPKTHACTPARTTACMQQGHIWLESMRRQILHRQHCQSAPRLQRRLQQQPLSLQH